MAKGLHIMTTMAEKKLHPSLEEQLLIKRPPEPSLQLAKFGPSTQQVGQSVFIWHGPSSSPGQAARAMPASSALPAGTARRDSSSGAGFPMRMTVMGAIYYPKTQIRHGLSKQSWVLQPAVPRESHVGGHGHRYKHSSSPSC